MALSNGVSLAVSNILVTLILSGMVANRQWLSATQMRTVLSGFIGSLLFMCALTSIGNMKTLMFGKDAVTGLSEVVICLLVTASVSLMVHRVSVTCCILFSLLALYNMVNISNKEYSSTRSSVSFVTSKRKKY